MKLTEFSDFLYSLGLKDKISYNEFKESARIIYDSSTGSSIKEFLLRLEKKNPNDARVINKELWLRSMYEMFVTNREEFLFDFFQDHFEHNGIIEKFNYENDNIIVEKKINGKYNSKYSKLLKNIHYDVAYATKKLTTNNNLDFIGIIKRLVTTFEIKHSLLIPTSYDAIITKSHGKIFAIIRGTSNRPSFFNPWTCGYLLNSLFTGNKILTPVLDWSSYALGFINSKWEEYVGIDVMPSVISKTNELLASSNKKYSLYCQPSEEILNSKDWLDKYKNYFDLVFFSPPYYNLEIYAEGVEQQSITKYSDYNKWIQYYWEETVKGCYASMADDSIFAFVISDFKGNNISNDMLEVAKKWFIHLDTYTLQWNSFTILDAKKMKSGNFENLFILRKGNGKLKIKEKTKLF